MRRLLVLGVAVFAALGLTADDVIRKGFNVAEGGTLHLDGAIGNIKIVSGGTGVAIEVVRDADGKRGDRRLREHKITFEQRGNDVVISSDFEGEKRWKLFGWDDDDYDVQWNIRVPARYNVDVFTSGGNIDLADIGGTVAAKTSGGNIKTGRLRGQSKLNTSGGNITVSGASAAVDANTSGGSINIGDTSGAVDADTSGGSITLARIQGEVRARSSGGNIRIEDALGTVDASTSGGSITARISQQPRSDSKLSTSGGGVTVTLAPTIRVDLDARASGGGVRSDIPVTTQGTQEDDSLQGKVNGGGPKLVLRTSGGGIRVKGL